MTKRAEFDYNDLRSRHKLKPDRIDYAPITAMASFRDYYVITGHKDGCILLWRFSTILSKIETDSESEITYIFVDEFSFVWVGNKKGMVSVFDTSPTNKLSFKQFLEKHKDFPENKTSCKLSILFKKY